MEWIDTALVLGVGRFRESDLWVRLLTRRHGIVSAFAFGGSKSRKRFCGCLDLCNELQVSAKTTRNGMYLSLQEGRLIQGPQRLRTDWNRLGMFMNCVRFLEAVGVASEGSPEVFLLLKDMFSLLEEADIVQDILPVLFRLRLTSLQGYAPALSGCAVCGSQDIEQTDFLVSEGILVCPRCGKKSENAVRLERKSLDVLRQVQEESPLRWRFLFSGAFGAGEDALLSAETRRECSRAVDGFVQYHLGIIWDRGRFRRM